MNRTWGDFTFTMPRPLAFRMKSFLGCIPLQRGCIILGTLGMFFLMLSIRNYVTMLVDFELTVQHCRRKDDFGYNSSSESNEDDDHDDHHDDGRHKNRRRMRNFGDFFAFMKDRCPTDVDMSLLRFVLGFSCVTYALYLFLTMMMVYGAVKKKPRMMTPLMVWVTVEIFFDLLNLLGLLHRPSMFTMISLFDIVFNCYFMLVVSSYYLELKENEEGGPRVTVVAVTRSPNHEMMVVIPTGPKDDPPPPYPGVTNEFVSACNPAYNPYGTDLPAYSSVEGLPTSPPECSAGSMPPPPFSQTSSQPLVPGAQSVAQPGAQPPVQPGAQPPVQPGAQPPVQPGAQPPAQPGAQPPPSRSSTSQQPGGDMGEAIPLVENPSLLRH